MRDCDYNLTNVVLRVAKKMAYYFDENGIYRGMPLNEVQKNKQIKMLEYDRYGEKVWDRFSNYSNIFGNLKQNDLDSIISRLTEGEKIETFYKEIQYVKENKNPVIKEGIESFITKIDRPIFMRNPENDRKNSFDSIMIEVYILTRFRNKIQYIKDNKDEIINMVVSKLENDSAFKKYGVPINFLKLSSITLREKYNYIQFVFEFKEIKP